MRASVFVIGADGQVGRRLCRRLVNDDRAVTGMHREPGQFESVVETGAMPLIGDLVTDGVSKLARWMDGHDAVVLVLDGLRRAGFFESRALEKAVAAARVAGIDRFILVSGLPADEPVRHTTAASSGAGQRTRGAEVAISRSELDWIIVRHGVLVDGDGSGRVTAGPVVLDALASAGTVATFVARLLDEPLFGRDIVELTDGDVGVSEAVGALISGRGAAVGRRLLIA